MNSATLLRSIGSTRLVRPCPNFTAWFDWSVEELASRPFGEWLHPDDVAHFDRAAADGTGSVDARHRTKSGEWEPMEWTFREFEGHTMTLGHTVREPSGRRIDPSSESPSRISGTRTETLDAMARIVEAKSAGLRCTILLIDPTTRNVIAGAGPSLPKAYNEAIESLRMGPAVGSCGTASYWDVPIVVEDIDKDPLWSEYREVAALAGVGACWSYPIRSTDGVVLGAMALYADRPLAPTRAQMESLEIAAHMVGLAVERQGLEARLRESSKLEAMGRLAGGVAHDFNNLMTVVLGQVEVLRGHLHEPPEPRALDAIYQAAHQATEITRQLLAFGRRQQRAPEQVDVNTAIADLMSVLDPLLGADVSVRVSSDLSLRPVTIDRAQLGAILLNLSLNARDAMPNGGTIFIETRPANDREMAAFLGDRPPGRYAAITVRDTGSGMDEATRARAFEPFFTTKGPAHGTGLGLATVYGLTTQNGGVVRMDSREGEGSTFTLLFPIDGDGATEAADGADPHARKGSILLVEDNDQLRELLIQALQSSDFSVTAARDGVEAWALLEGGLGIDVLVTDVAMPQMDGRELARRARERDPHTAVVFISAYPFERQLTEEVLFQGCAFLAKPFTLAELRRRVREVLEAPSASRQRSAS